MSSIHPYVWIKKRGSSKILFLIIFYHLSMPVFSMAGSFRITPVVTKLNAKMKNTVIRVTNTGDEKLTVQLSVKEWNQDETGSDTYQPTKDIVFFPKIVTIEKDEERIIRIGYQGKENVASERAYRLFVEELPIIEPGETVLKFALTMAVPIYISPLKEIKKPSLENIEFFGGKLALNIKNSGNTHIFVKRITVTVIDEQNMELFKKDNKGLNILAGAAGTVAIEIPGKDCIRANKVRVAIEAEDNALERDFILDKTQCVDSKENAKDPGGL